MPATFEAYAPFDEMCQRAAHDIEAYLSVLQVDKKILWKEQAAGRLAEMMNSKDRTVHYLNVPDGSLRLVAASLVADYWQSDESFVAPCLTLAFSDPESAIRGAALSALLYKLQPYIEDKSGVFGELLTFLKRLDPSFSDPTIYEVHKHAAEAEQWASEQALLERQQLACEHLDIMRRSRSTAIGYLDDPAPNLRSAALLVLYDHWKKEPFDLGSIGTRILTHDRDVEVRIHAQEILGNICFGTNDPGIGRLLASIVRDDSEPVKLRKAAYVSLFVVRGMPAQRVFDAVSTQFRRSADVDWQFVESFLR